MRECEALVELVAQRPLRVTGIDRNEDAIARCRLKLAGAFLAEPFTPERFEAESFDLVINLGASPGFDQLLREIVPLLRPGGRVLIGDGFWARTPHPEYLDFLGAKEASLHTHEGNLRALHAAGLILELAEPTSPDEWDRYEDRYHANMVAYLRSHPDDPDHAAFAERCRAWREMYLCHGRGTLGFGLYQARRSG